MASATNDVAGDGTTTATVLTRAILVEGCKSVAAGMNPMDLRRGINLAVRGGACLLHLGGGWAGARHRVLPRRRHAVLPLFSRALALLCHRLPSPALGPTHAPSLLRRWTTW